MRTKSIALMTAGLCVLPGMSSAFAQAESSGIETVVVTGSRIPRPELSSPNPIQSVGEQEIRLSGIINLTDFLRRIPALTGSIGDLQESG